MWLPSWTEGFNTEWANDRQAIEKEAREAFCTVIDRLRRETGTTSDFQIDIETGNAASVLVSASATADLIVVGTCRRPGLALGSVSSSVVHHARCPVVVVPPP